MDQLKLDKGASRSAPRPRRVRRAEGAPLQIVTVALGVGLCLAAACADKPLGKGTGSGQGTAAKAGSGETRAAKAKRRNLPPPPRQAADRFFKALVAKKFEKAASYFDKTMGRVMGPQRLAQAWGQLLAGGGAYKGVKAVRQRKVRAYAQVVYTVELGKKTVNVQISIDAAGKVSGLYYRPVVEASKRPPPPYSDKTRLREVTLEIGKAPWKLPATLTIPVLPYKGRTAPKGRGRERPPRWPAVVLVHGSGPHDRDETVGPNKPFRDLAWGLASRGVAVLRYEKRTKAHREGVTKALATLTVKEETIDDAVAAVRTLAARVEIDPKRIVVLGHSLGGYLLPRMVASRGEAPIAGLVFMAANARPLEVLVLEQFRYLAEVDGRITGHEKKRLQHVAAKIARLRKGITAKTPRHQLPLNLTAAYWLDLQSYNPLVAVKKVRLPMLFLQGKRDYQVTLKDLAAWRRTLGKRARYKVYPKANHLLIDGEGKPRPQEYKRPAYVTKEVVVDIASFVAKLK